MEKFGDIINGDKLTLVDFFATWCGPCKKQHPILEQLKEEMGDRVRVLTLDVDRNAEVSDAYRVQSVPTLMLFRNGQVLWRQSGLMMLDDLKRVIETV
ncbi:MAG: thioredoxin [Bacteroidaceae bacterium]|jgi:thioredoxin 1|nr:thioredoxin [Bacteroidaceae bacterium]